VIRFLLLLAAPLFGATAFSAELEIPVTQEQRAALGIEVVEVPAVREAPIAALPAIVKLPGDSTRAVVIPMGGTVTQLLAQQGQEVTRGQALLQVRSRDFLEVQAQLSAANAQVSTLRSQVERDRALVADGIAPARRLAESEAQLSAAQAQSHSRSALLSSVKPARDVPGEYRLLAPANGVLAEAGLEAGDSVDGDTVAFYILDADKVWLEAQLPERLIDQIATGLRVEAGSPARSGRVVSVGQVIDPHTRSALLRAELSAGPGLRPGQSTELVVFGPVATGTVVVPATALVRIDGQDSVFRATENGFVVVPVKSNLRTEEGVAVTGKDLAGSRIAVAGVSALKALAQGT
jgi:cobalt-zinc-cadmium efflux system membrane fusion protein